MTKFDFRLSKFSEVTGRLCGKLAAVALVLTSVLVAPAGAEDMTVQGLDCYDIPLIPKFAFPANFNYQILGFPGYGFGGGSTFLRIQNVETLNVDRMLGAQVVIVGANRKPFQRCRIYFNVDHTAKFNTYKRSFFQVCFTGSALPTRQIYLLPPDISTPVPSIGPDWFRADFDYATVKAAAEKQGGPFPPGYSLRNIQLTIRSSEPSWTDTNFVLGNIIVNDSKSDDVDLVQTVRRSDQGFGSGCGTWFVECPAGVPSLRRNVKESRKNAIDERRNKPRGR